MIEEHVQESAVEGSRAILAWSQGSPLRDAQRSTVATRWRTAALCSRRPIRSGVCVCVSRLKSSVSFNFSKRFVCLTAQCFKSLGRGWGDVAAPERDSTGYRKAKSEMVYILATS